MATLSKGYGVDYTWDTSPLPGWSVTPAGGLYMRESKPGWNPSRPPSESELGA